MQNSEYEIQHFGFSVEQIALERRYIINRYLLNALDALVKNLPHIKEIIEQQKENVTKRINNVLEEQVQSLEKVDQKYFSIPEHVLLTKDFAFAKQLSTEDKIQIEEEFDALKNKFFENAILIQNLISQKESYMALEPVLQEERRVHNLLADVLKTLNNDKLAHNKELMQKMLQNGK